MSRVSCVVVRAFGLHSSIRTKQNTHKGFARRRQIYECWSTLDFLDTARAGDVKADSGRLEFDCAWHLFPVSALVLYSCGSRARADTHSARDIQAQRDNSLPLTLASAINQPPSWPPSRLQHKHQTFNTVVAKTSRLRARWAGWQSKQEQPGAQ